MMSEVFAEGAGGGEAGGEGEGGGGARRHAVARRVMAVLWRAARKGDVSRMSALLAAGHDPNSGNPRMLEASS